MQFCFLTLPLEFSPGFSTLELLCVYLYLILFDFAQSLVEAFMQLHESPSVFLNMGC